MQIGHHIKAGGPGSNTRPSPPNINDTIFKLLKLLVPFLPLSPFVCLFYLDTKLLKARTVFFVLTQCTEQ